MIIYSYEASILKRCPRDEGVPLVSILRIILEHSAPVWHSSLSEENRKDLERVQKTALKIILGNKFKSYDNALKILDLQTLEERRTELCITFAKRTSKHPKFKHLFPFNSKLHTMNTRNAEKFKVYDAKTERLKASSIIFMQKKLNEAEH